MDSLKKSFTDLGTKLKDGAQQFAADHEQEISSAKAKAGEWKAKAEDALAGKKDKKDDAGTGSGSGADDDDTLGREREQESEAEADAPPKSYPGDVVLGRLHNQVNGIAAKLEATGKDIKDKEEVQKFVVQPLLTQLSVAQQKFASFKQQSSPSSSEDQTQSTEEDNVTFTATAPPAIASATNQVTNDPEDDDIL